MFLTTGGSFIIDDLTRGGFERGIELLMSDGTRITCVFLGGWGPTVNYLFILCSFIIDDVSITLPNSIISVGAGNINQTTI